MFYLLPTMANGVNVEFEKGKVYLRKKSFLFPIWFLLISLLLGIKRVEKSLINK